MSADKRKSLQRRLRLLEAAFLGASSRRDGRGYLTFHHEGGHALDDPDIQRLVADGHLGGLERRNWMGEQRVKRLLPRGPHGGYGLPGRLTTVLTVTPKGVAFFQQHRRHLRHGPTYRARKRYVEWCPWDAATHLTVVNTTCATSSTS